MKYPFALLAVFLLVAASPVAAKDAKSGAKNSHESAETKRLENSADKDKESSESSKAHAKIKADNKGTDNGTVGAKQKTEIKLKGAPKDERGDRTIQRSNKSNAN